MGDIPNPKSPSPDMEQSLAGKLKQSQQPGVTASTQTPQPEPQQRPVPPRNDSGAAAQNAFSTQFDMTQPSGPTGRPGPFHMAPMANALPYNQYRPNQFHGHPQRYGQHASPPMMAQMGHASQFMGSPQEPMPQGYYVPQQQIPQYYAVENSVNHQHMQARQNMAYYAPQVIMGQPQHTPYYVQVSPYPEQHQQNMQQHQTMLPPMMTAPYAPGQQPGTARKPSQRSTRRNRHNNDAHPATGEFIFLYWHQTQN